MARPKEFVEEDVLQKATEVFWKKGFNGASMQDLVEAMGINRASLYDTFGDKQHLYLSCLGQYQDYNRRQFTEVMARSFSARERVRSMLMGLVDEAVNDSDRKGCFLTNAALERASEDPATQQVVCRNLRAMEEELRDIIASGQQSGELNSDLSAPTLGQYFTTLISGLRVRGKINPDRVTLEAMVDLSLRVLD